MGFSWVPTPALRDPQGVLGQKAAAMRLFVWAQVGRGAVEGADVRLAVRAMATDMGWAAPMMRKATAMRFGGGTTHRKGAPLRLEASRSEERRVGKEWVSTCRSRGEPIN